MAEQTNDEPAVGSPLSETLRALNEQSTPELMRDARRYAEQRARLVRESGRPIPKNYAAELVHDAHVDTWLGDAPWSPSRCSLLVHLRGVIKQRTWAEIRQGLRFRHCSLDALSRDARPANDIASLREVESALACASCGDLTEIVFAALVARVCIELRSLASADRASLAIVRCWESGFTERDEIMEITGLDVPAYDRTRKRLLYLSHNLPPDLREAVQGILRSAS